MKLLKSIETEKLKKPQGNRKINLHNLISRCQAPRQYMSFHMCAYVRTSSLWYYAFTFMHFIQLNLLYFLFQLFLIFLCLVWFLSRMQRIWRNVLLYFLTEKVNRTQINYYRGKPLSSTLDRVHFVNSDQLFVSSTNVL